MSSFTAAQLGRRTMLRSISRSAAATRRTSIACFSSHAQPRRRVKAVNVPLAELRLERLSTLAEEPHRTLSSSMDSLDDFCAQHVVDPATVARLVAVDPTPLTLFDMYQYGRGGNSAQRLRNARFLYEELPIRIAHRAHDLLTLPFGLGHSTPIRQVAGIYLDYLQRIQAQPMPENEPQEEAFTDLLQTFVLDRTSVPVSIARGVQVWSEDGRRDQVQDERLQEMEDALERFFTARVGLRFLTEHHVLSSKRASVTKALRQVTDMFPNDKEEPAVGCIQPNCDLIAETKRVADLVSQQTLACYKIAPEIKIVDAIDERHRAAAFTYVPHHLHYMLAELLKNSARAVTQQYLAAELNGIEAKLEPITVVIVKGDEDVTIKVADKGGGIPRSKMATIWKFGHSFASDTESESDFGTDEVSGAQIRGYGLPLARIYARYFGGELNLKSMEGYGVDAYLHLPRLGDACENLPEVVARSPGDRSSLPPQQRRFSSAAHGRRRGWTEPTRVGVRPVAGRSRQPVR